MFIVIHIIVFISYQFHNLFYILHPEILKALKLYRLSCWIELLCRLSKCCFMHQKKKKDNAINRLSTAMLSMVKNIVWLLMMFLLVIPFYLLYIYYKCFLKWKICKINKVQKVVSEIIHCQMDSGNKIILVVRVASLFFKLNLHHVSSFLEENIGFYWV